MPNNTNKSTPNSTINYLADTTNASNSVTLTQICSYSRSAHDPVIYLPVIGPIIDIASISNTENLDWWEFPLSEFLPIFGPAIVQNQGYQNCVYSSFVITPTQKSIGYKPEAIEKNIISMAVGLSNQNCSAYQNLVYGTIGALGFNDTVLNKLAGTGATIAGVAGTAGGAAGLAAAGQLTSSSVDGIQKYFFQSATLPHLFSTINTTRTQLLNSLEGVTKDSKNDYWGYDKTSKTMPYGKFKEFINNLDEACSLTQGAIDLDQAVKNGNGVVSGTQISTPPATTTSTTTTTTPAVAKKGSTPAKPKSTTTTTTTKNTPETTPSPALIERFNLNGVPFQ